MLIVYNSTAHFVVSHDSLFTGMSGQPNGPALAQSVIDYCEYYLTRLSMLFGNIMPPAASLPIQINLLPAPPFGASNNLVNVINCFCTATTDPAGLPALVVAEEAEIFMNLQANGWMPAWSNGESLSRLCAQILYPNRAWLFQTGQQWLNSAGRPNWVDNVEPTDQDSIATGCGTLFLNYLAYQLNLHWPDIITTGAPTTKTLAEPARILGAVNSWTDFSNLIATNLPPGAFLPPQPTSFGQAPEPTDDPFPYPAPQAASTLYMRHNLADDGTSHTGSLSDSPDIILKNNPVINPQVTYSTAASVNSDSESDPDVIIRQANYIYLRVWNRGTDAANVFASVYWSDPATLVTPNLWNLIGSAYYPAVPPGSSVQVCNPGIVWPADKLPGPGHYCFVAAVGNAENPQPNSASFATFDDFVNYIYANNNITWRNFNVIAPPPRGKPHLSVPLRFRITGAWDRARPFSLETHAQLPEGSRLALQVPQWLGHGLKLRPGEFEEIEGQDADPDDRKRLSVPLLIDGTHNLGSIELPVNTAAASQMLVQIPARKHSKPHSIVIRQLYGTREVGRISWFLLPPR